MQVMAVNGHDLDRGQLTEEWRRANDRVRELERLETGWADDPTVGPLPEALSSLEAEVLADPIFRRVFQLVPVRIGMVELDRLVVYQKHINLRFAERLRSRLGDEPSPEKVFRLCLPYDHPHPPSQPMQTAGNSFAFVSPSADFRLLEARLLRPDQLTDYQSQGPVASVLALVVGYGSNFLNAFEIEGRLVLNNGSHRAYALREMGVTHVPCIVQTVSRREELEVVASGPLPKEPERYLEAPRPPVLKDYFDPALRKIVPVPKKNRMVKLTFGVEQMDVPAAERAISAGGR